MYSIEPKKAEPVFIWFNIVRTVPGTEQVLKELVDE